MQTLLKMNTTIESFLKRNADSYIRF